MVNEVSKVNDGVGGPLLSLATYAKHRGCSVPAVSKAVKRGRLTKSVQWVGGQPKITSVALADDEWASNTRRRPVSVETTPPFPVTEAASFSIVTTAGFVLLGWIHGEEPDFERDQVWAVTPATARAMAEALLAAAGRARLGENDFKEPS